LNQSIWFSCSEDQAAVFCSERFACLTSSVHIFSKDNSTFSWKCGNDYQKDYGAGLPGKPKLLLNVGEQISTQKDVTKTTMCSSTPGFPG
jgi:hypothetical protein